MNAECRKCLEKRELTDNAFLSSVIRFVAFIVVAALFLKLRN